MKQHLLFRGFLRTLSVRVLFLVLLFFIPARMWGVGFTPTDAGLVLNFEPGDQFLLSVVIDGKEYFVCDYPSYTSSTSSGGKFNYAAGDYLKLIPQAAGATTPSAASVWTVDTALTRISGKVNYSLGGISYTMWGNSGKTLYAAESPTKSSAFKFLGYLTDNHSHGDLCDVVFVVPTIRATTNMDPNNTLALDGTYHRGTGDQSWAFDGKMGVGFAGMLYREVYWFDIPRSNTPNAYTNASLVTFNRTTSNKSWNAGTINPGKAAYAFADTKHNPTTRTLFRIYPLNKPFSSCSSYFLGWDVQDYKKYRQSNTMTDSTSARKIYTLDHFACMEREGETAIFKSPDGQIQTYDSAYYYVGKNNKFYSSAAGEPLGSSTDPNSYSEFHSIRELRVRALKGAPTTYAPGPGAYGCAVIDTTSGEANLGATFEPKGYFFQTSSGVNVPMRQTSANTWMSDQMWYIAGEYMDLEGRVVLLTDSVFSMADPGAEIIGWSQWVKASDIPVAGTGGPSAGLYGWPRIYTDSPEPNGNIEFVEANKDTVVIYHNNGHFGVDIPYQYPIKGETTVTIQDARLLGDYEFAGWAASSVGAVVIFPKDSTSKPLRVGQTINLKSLPGDLTYAHGASGDTLHLYAKATYTGSINVAVSFEKDGKRYFLTHPGEAPRFARARTYTDWTEVRQGIGDANNSDPNYLTSYTILGNEGVCAECVGDEHVWDPMYITMRGGKDSLVFYEDHQPNEDEYVGLFYTDPNTIIANNTWSGLFKSSEGWPTPANPCIENTKLSSTHYLHRVAGVIKRDERGNSDKPNIVYNPSGNQFDGTDAAGTDFMLSGVGVVDEHYIILPDTSDATTPWRNEITFDDHNEAQLEQVWSKLIGKHLLAQMKVGDDTIYFHPDRDKTFNTATELRLSNDYRLRHEFTFIPDSRAIFSEVDEANRASMEETENAFCCNIHSGATTPIGPTEDIVDTLRVRLMPASTSKIKAYYGRWKKQSADDGLTVAADGSRYRNILIKTKTYHYGPEQANLILKPVLDLYSFGALAGESQALNFHVIKERYSVLYDSEGHEIRTEVLGRDTITTGWDLSSATCSLKSDAVFTIGTKTASAITLTTKAQNAEGDNLDTLTVTSTVTIDAVSYPITAKVPLIQTDLTGDELVWSAIHPTSGKRFFITIESGALAFRNFDLNSSRWQRNKQELKKGSKDANNSDKQYITPWKFEYSKTDASQLGLKTLYGINLHFNIASETTPEVHASDSALLTYEYVHVYTNDNGNIEEQVKLKYGSDKWLQFTGTSLTLVDTKEEGTVFSWAYLSQEYELLNNGTYPSVDSLVFGYNNGDSKSIQTCYKAYREYSMLVGNTLTYLCRENQTNLTTLTAADGDWRTNYTITRKADARTFDKDPEDPPVVSGLGDPVINTTNLTTTITPTPLPTTSPMNVTIDGKYVNIVDTLMVTLSLKDGAPSYRFKDWKNVNSLSDACLKIPLVRKTYHTAPYDSIICSVVGEEYNYAFPATLPKGVGVVESDSCHTFVLNTSQYTGTKTLDKDNNVIVYDAGDPVSLTASMDLDNINTAEIRLIDEYGKIPDWCEISAIEDHSVTVKCKKDGIRSPRLAYIYFAYIVTDKDSQTKFVNYRLTISQASLFQYANNQTLTHSRGVTGDEKVDGMQQVHENKRVLYYYNPEPYAESDQDVELPVRERGFYGWWRWYREGKDELDFDVSDMDVLDSLWIAPPRNVGRYNFPYRIIGDSVMLKKKDGTDSIKILVQMGRYTVFHYPSRDYNTKVDPPAKSPLVKAPQNEKTLTYVVDISNYYDNLPLSLTSINQVDIAALDTMQEIIEPTLSLREIFELHPWTEMADTLDHYKSANAATYELKDEKYMEDHVVMAPTGNRLLLSTEQRYNYENLTKKGHSESLLGYYMHDDNWSSGGWDKARKDTMIWCGGWDADCEWFIYDPSSKTYTPCSYTVTESDDFLSVPAKGSTTGGAADTVYYCLRAQSWKTTFADDDDEDALTEGENTEEGDYWFNICRYKVVYHNPNKYGPFQEKGTGKNAKAIITNDEIEQDYEVLERLNFDYIQPGSSYHVYPHPLPWKDASYGYSYPVSPEIPDNRYHNDFAPNFPGVGEYGLINRIPYSNYWHKMEQHGGAENGYMIYCDGMSSSGQVAALSLSTHLCEGQKMYFSAYVGNPSNQKGKANPNFTFSVQGWDDEAKKWEDITTYMTGDIQPSDKWSQIFFPIEHEKAYDDFRVRIYNMASDFDGNDFIIDDMCIFATKPPVIAYQANTRCVESNENDSVIHVVLRVDYQGFTDISYNNSDVNYTVEQMTKDSVYSFVPMIDHYLSEDATHTGRIEAGVKVAPDTIFGAIHMPARDFIPMHEDSIFSNLNELARKFEESVDAKKVDPAVELFRQGYIYENLDGDIRPVLYVVHKAKMTSDKKYTVRMSIGYTGLMSSQCAMTSDLKVTNRMMLMLNGEEQEEKEVSGMCANTTYDVSMRVRGTLIQDSVAPMPLTGSCSCDWLLYGDTTSATSEATYGYKYSDIEKVIRQVLRYEPGAGESNSNRFAKNLGEVNRNVMDNIQKKCTLETDKSAYEVLSDLVNNGFLTLYKQNILVSVNSKDSAKYVVFPIVGTGTDDLEEKGMEVCPTPIVIKLKARETETGVPLIIGGLHRDSTQAKLPITVLADAENANKELAVPVDSIRTMIGIHAITLLSTDDPNYREGVHKLNLTPGRTWPRDISRYYIKGDTIILTPASNNNYEMRPGYNYTFNIEMVSATDDPNDKDGCPIGNVPFIVSVVPDVLRWAPADQGNNNWNDPMNWIGVTADNVVIHENARFAPLSSTDIIIPAMTNMPAPCLPYNDPLTGYRDSVQAVGFVYNTCDDIRFLPGAAIGQQQRLGCDVVVVDMTMPYNKWALRAAPVTGMLSGDIYMADADLSGETKMWSVGSFDANGRNYKTGNATFWLSLYDREIIQKGNGDQVSDSTREAAADWSRLANGMTEDLSPAQGWAVYARTKSGDAADIRLPKNDDVYYYYYASGDQSDISEPGLRAQRDENAGGSGMAGKLAFYPDSVPAPKYTLTNGTASTSFVFGNPTMGYIDIWGFVADNGLVSEFQYIDAEGSWQTVTKSTVDAAITANPSLDTITNRQCYLPPMHAMVVKVAEATTSKRVTLNTNRIVTAASQIVRGGGGSGAPKRQGQSIRKGIMTVTATNPAGAICTSRLRLGQGYHNEVLSGEDAILTTVNLNNYSSATPATPFNIYAAEQGYGLSIDLLDSIVNVPLSFSMTESLVSAFEPVTYLWFTGVNSIDGPLVLYDALTDTERPITDGICLPIETPEVSHERRYYIRRPGYTEPSTDPTTTGVGSDAHEEQAVKIVYHGNVYILRNGHVFTIFGQKVR